jgi:predicted nuclease of restriction endonuclease-like RecB superfamily
MLRLAFQIENADGTKVVEVGPASLVAWERKTGRKVSNFADGIGAEDMAWLVWHAEKRTGNTSANFDQYLDSLTDLSDAPDPKVTSDEGPSGD